ncbi:MAG: 3-isopropylmalate dehydratase [Anaerolineae bacterium]|jgi:3-isopropylmalate/(R)-2-methylmalate dehydratase small subunit
MRKTEVGGRLWVLTDSQGDLYNDIDTDMIFHNQYLHITDVDKMGPYTLDNLKGWESFAQSAEPGDVVMAGRNFGAGSSRQQAVDCFRALGIGAIVAESYGAIYKRNAINSGMPIIAFPGVTELTDEFRAASSQGGVLRVDFRSGQLTLPDGRTFQAKPFSQVQMDIYQAGNLFAYGKSLEEE